MRLLIFGLLVLGTSALSAQARDSWQPLPTSGFIVGRVATERDIDAGKAAFAIRNGTDSISAPLRIRIPQYAVFNDNGTLVPVIVIQAELAQAKRVLGARKADGTVVVGLLSDFTLLGTRPPSNNSFKPNPLRSFKTPSASSGGSA
jgi:hypothetical protein